MERSSGRLAAYSETEVASCWVLGGQIHLCRKLVLNREEFETVKREVIQFSESGGSCGSKATRSSQPILTPNDDAL